MGEFQKSQPFSSKFGYFLDFLVKRKGVYPTMHFYHFRSLFSHIDKVIALEFHCDQNTIAFHTLWMCNQHVLVRVKSGQDFMKYLMFTYTS